MTIDKQKEILDLRKLYLNQFEKHETKILIAWFVVIVLPLFVLWVQGKMNGYLLLIIALFSCLLDIVLQAWRKNSFNDLIKSVEEGKISTIKPENNHSQEIHNPTTLIKPQKVEYKETDSELMRLAIITLLIAGMFGILQVFPEGKTFDSVGIGMILKVIASTMLYAPFPIFAIYVMLLGLNSRYEKGRNFIKTQAFFYDLGIFLTTFIIILATLFASFIWLLVKVPTFPMWIIVSAMWIFIIVTAIIIWKVIMQHIRKR